MYMPVSLTDHKNLFIHLLPPLPPYQNPGLQYQQAFPVNTPTEQARETGKLTENLPLLKTQSPNLTPISTKEHVLTPSFSLFPHLL